MPLPTAGQSVIYNKPNDDRQAASVVSVETPTLTLNLSADGVTVTGVQWREPFTPPPAEMWADHGVDVVPPPAPTPPKRR